MNTEKMKKRRYVPQQLTLALVLSAAALQASAEGVNLHSDISITKEDPCGVTVTSEGTTITGSIRVDDSGRKELRLNDTGGAKITVQASGGEDCRVGTLKLAFTPGTQIRGSSALSSTNGSLYFPFDYALGPTQVTNSQGKNEDESVVFAQISTYRFMLNEFCRPSFSREIKDSLVPKDRQYHLHDGYIGWQTNGEKVYLDKYNIPFWLNTMFETVVFHGETSKKVKFSFIPVTASDGYDKATGKRNRGKINSDESFSYTASLIVTTI
ncbi:hypothetical protein [Serratia sp. 1D1416]|uniref:hypothetical protein n=1 Tax=Serratia sp. 1D1416 TaxID=2447890 RepID=UPI001013D1C6|nr:hypothetical protein [Serratia sp. 1D1416]